jgi:hypothetical protein
MFIAKAPSLGQLAIDIKIDRKQRDVLKYGPGKIINDFKLV